MAVYLESERDSLAVILPWLEIPKCHLVGVEHFDGHPGDEYLGIKPYPQYFWVTYCRNLVGVFDPAGNREIALARFPTQFLRAEVFKTSCTPSFESLHPLEEDPVIYIPKGFQISRFENDYRSGLIIPTKPLTVSCSGIINPYPEYLPEYLRRIEDEDDDTSDQD